MTVSGDGRCDSPGKCAKFCTYTLIERSSNTIIHSETVDKSEVQYKSSNMECESVHRSLTYLKDKLNIAEITTDPSTAVTKILGSYIVALYWSCLYIQAL